MGQNILGEVLEFSSLFLVQIIQNHIKAGKNIPRSSSPTLESHHSPKAWQEVSAGVLNTSRDGDCTSSLDEGAVRTMTFPCDPREAPKTTRELCHQNPPSLPNFFTLRRREVPGIAQRRDFLG